MILALNCVRVAQALNESNLGYPTPAEFLTKEWSLSSTEGSAKKCAACTAAVLKVSSEVLKQSTYDYLVPLATDICMLVAFDASTVCPGIIPMMATPVIDMIGRELLSKERICNEFLEVCAIPSFETITVDEYSTRVLAEKPEAI